MVRRQNEHESVPLAYGASLTRYSGGSSQFPAMLLVPGGPGLTSEYLFPLIEEFSHTHRVFGYEYPDQFPVSSGPGESLDVLTETFSSALTVAAGETALTIIGHSAGAMLALGQNIKYPSGLARLILLSGSPDGRWTAIARDYLYRTHFDGLAEAERAFQQEPTPENLKTLFRSWWPYYFSEPNRSLALRYLEGLNCRVAPYLHQADFFSKKHSARMVPSTAEVILINGCDDHVTPPQVYDGHEILKHPKLKSFVISGAGHFPWVEKPKEIRSILTPCVAEC